MPDRRWLWLACRLAQDLWDDELWHVLATRGVRVARETGALSLLPNALNYLAALNVHSGAFATAAALIDEVDSITPGNRTPVTQVRGDHAGRGSATMRRQALVELRLAECDGARARARALACGGGHRVAAQRARPLRPRRSLPRGRPASTRTSWLLRLGPRRADRGRRPRRAPDEAAAALERLQRAHQRAAPNGRSVSKPAAAGLLSDDEPLYREAVERLATSRGVVHLARARLLYGEWLRRENRRVDAREQLRRPRNVQRHRGRGFAERARRELVATGESAPKRTVETRDDLTPQEAQIARWRATGRRTRRSAPSCSSARAPSSTTCARCSPSSTSTPARSYAAHLPKYPNTSVPQLARQRRRGLA